MEESSFAKTENVYQKSMITAAEEIETVPMAYSVKMENVSGIETNALGTEIVQATNPAKMDSV